MSRQESWKTDKKELREQFDATLKAVWETWVDAEMAGSPFKRLNRLVESPLSNETINLMHWEAGWLRGVSEAFGWSLDRPGPREWSPRDR